MRNPSLLGLTGDQRADTGRLRRMKLTATAFLVVAAGVFLASTALHGTARGYVQAGAEAAMVGGLADWFAVTALFRRPLGLPIPHTALIPRKKDELATKLGEFVTGYFLTPEALQEQVAESGVVAKLGSWLADPAHATALAADAAAAASAAIEAMDQGVVVDYVIELLRRDQARRSYAPVLGRLLDRALDGGAQAPLVDLLADRARAYLVEHQQDLHPTVKRFIEDRHWVAWLVTTDKLVTRLLRDLITELEDIGRFPEHPVRVAVETMLRSVAVDLRDDPATAGRVDQVAARLLEDPKAQEVLRDAIEDGIASVRESLSEPGGALVERIAALLAQVGRRAAGEDPTFHDGIERWAQAMVGHAVRRYGGELTELIRRQVGGWPAQAASRRIELAVGRDLQFIRINGTVVGALAGLLIHVVAQLLP